MTHILGYARVSTPDQDLDGQRRRLHDAQAVRVFDDVISGKSFDRPGLTALLDYARPGICYASFVWTGSVAASSSFFIR